MSNSSLVSYTKISPNKTSPRKHVIDTITIHCVVGQCTVERLGEVFAPTSRQASSNYGIGYDGKIGMYVEEKDRSWCSSNGANDNRAITIEVASDTTHPYAVTDKAYNALIDLCTDICRRNGIKELKWKGDKSLIGQVDKQNMTVHRWFANKSCPGDYLYNRHGDIATEVNKRLNSVPVEPETPKTEDPVEMYRVRKTWADAKSQIGAYKNLTYAKAEADKNPGYSVFNSSGECVYPIVEKAPEAEVYTVDSFSVGEIVNFAGGKHYTNASASNGSTVKASLAKVTSKYPRGKHQLHLRAVNSDGKYIGGVYGWVDVDTVTKRTTAVAKKTVGELAREVINGKWGNGAARKTALTNAGYDYSAVQKRVNELLK